MKNNKRPLTQALIERSSCEGESYTFLWDTKQDGLGVKIEPSGFKSFVYRYRFEGKERRRVVASCNKISLEQARELANDYAYKVSKGVDPFAENTSLTLYEVCLEYIEYRKEGKGRDSTITESTYKVWKHQIDKYVKDSVIGKKKINTLTIGEATTFLEKMAATPVQANRTRTLLNIIFKYSIKKGYREIGTNVWEYVDKYHEEPKRPRFVESDQEGKDQPTLFVNYMLGAESGEVKDGRGMQIDLSWVYMIMLLYFTGARPDDVRDIKISEIDFDNSVIHRSRSKTGAKDIPISEPAKAVLTRAIYGVERKKGNPYLFAGKNGEGYRKSHGAKQWNNLRAATGISAPPYALRRYFALIGTREQKENGGSLAWISKMLGHKTEKMTTMYAGVDNKQLEIERKTLIHETEKVARRLSQTSKIK